MTSADKILACLRKRSAMTIDEIVAATKIPNGTVRPMMYELRVDGAVISEKIHARRVEWSIAPVQEQPAFHPLLQQFIDRSAQAVA